MVSLASYILNYRVMREIYSFYLVRSTRNRGEHSVIMLIEMPCHFGLDRISQDVIKKVTT